MSRDSILNIKFKQSGNHYSQIVGNPEMSMDSMLKSTPAETYNEGLKTKDKYIERAELMETPSRITLKSVLETSKVLNRKRESITERLSNDSSVIRVPDTSAEERQASVLEKSRSSLGAINSQHELRKNSSRKFSLSFALAT